MIEKRSRAEATCDPCHVVGAVRRQVRAPEVILFRIHRPASPRQSSSLLVGNHWAAAGNLSTGAPDRVRLGIERMSPGDGGKECEQALVIACTSTGTP